MIKFPIIIEKTNGNYSAYCPDLPGCIATGSDIEETIKQIKVAIKFHIEGMKREGIKVPKPSVQVKYIEVSV